MRIEVFSEHVRGEARFYSVEGSFRPPTSVANEWILLFGTYNKRQAYRVCSGLRLCLGALAARQVNA